MGDRERSDFRAYWVEHVRARAGRLSHFWQQPGGVSGGGGGAGAARRRERVCLPTLVAAENVRRRERAACGWERLDKSHKTRQVY